MQLLVIADDFTGALDTGTQFSQRGIATTLFLYDTMTAAQLSGCHAEVVVVDTESRHLSAGVAAQRVRAAAQLAKEAGCRIFFKKTDSTLRGNLGSELTAMQDVCGAKQLWFAPAYPAMGRTTSGGMHYIHGVPLAQTDFADDPFNPVHSSSIPAILAAQTDRTIRAVPAGQLLSEPETPELIIVDGQTEDDLRQTAQALAAAGRLTCLAGCAGFAAALEGLLPLHSALRRPRRKPGGLLLVCGSVHPQSVAQCRYAIAQCNYLDRPLTPLQMLSEQNDCDNLIHDVCSALQTGSHALVRVAGGREMLSETASAAGRLSLPPEEIPPRVAAKLGRITATILRLQPVSALIVFGGDTLLGIAAALGCVAVSPQTELLPGVVLSRMQTLSGEFDVITKAGGFGDETLMTQIERRLQDISGNTAQ